MEKNPELNLLEAPLLGITIQGNPAPAPCWILLDPAGSHRPGFGIGNVQSEVLPGWGGSSSSSFSWKWDVVAKATLPIKPTAPGFNEPNWLFLGSSTEFQMDLKLKVSLKALSLPSSCWFMNPGTSWKLPWCFPALKIPCASPLPAGHSRNSPGILCVSERNPSIGA